MAIEIDANVWGKSSLYVVRQHNLSTISLELIHNLPVFPGMT